MQTNVYTKIASGVGLIERDKSFITSFVRWSWLILIIFSILQCAFFRNLANITAVSSVILAWALLTNLFIRQDVLENYPLSTFLILGYTTTQFYFPLVFTFLEGKPIIFNLSLSNLVFFHSTAALFMLVVGHLFYRSVSVMFPSRKNSVLLKANFFQPPTDNQLWLMGLIGLASMFYVFFYSPSVGRVVSGVGDKFIQGLIPYSYAPFFIPCKQLFGSKEVITKNLLPKIAAFTVLLFIVSIGRNSRGAFMFGFTSVGFTFFLGLLLNVYKPHFFTVKNLAIVLFAFWFFTGPITDLATAMVMVRGQRDDISRTELLKLTLDTFKDKEAIRIFRLAGEGKTQSWDEHYMDNIFLARFSNLKYNDASLLEASKISKYDSDMLNFTINRFWATLPEPALKLLNVNVNKSAVNSFSFGDYIHYKGGANASVLGGFRTGHFAGTGMAAFGWWYVILLGIGIIPVYFILDKFFIRERISFNTKLDKDYFVEYRFSLCGLLTLTSIFMFLPSESIVSLATFLFRGWIQMVILYFLIFHLSKKLSSIFT